MFEIILDALSDEVITSDQRNHRAFDGVGYTCGRGVILIALIVDERDYEASL